MNGVGQQGHAATYPDDRDLYHRGETKRAECQPDGTNTFLRCDRRIAGELLLLFAMAVQVKNSVDQAPEPRAMAVPVIVVVPMIVVVPVIMIVVVPVIMIVVVPVIMIVRMIILTIVGMIVVVLSGRRIGE
jgi:hypothetical protein